MKKLVFIFAMACTMSLINCTADELVTNEENLIDPNEICPPSDRNCNGIKDWEED